MDESTTLKRIEEAAAGLQSEYLRTLQALVRIPSVIGAEAAAQGFIEELYRSSGLQVTKLAADIERLQKHPAYMPSTCPDYRGRPNIIGRLPGSAGGRSLLLNGHVDVVPVEPSEQWTRDPWEGVIEGDRLYGRGAGDMKAGLLANYFALKVLKRAGLQPAGDLLLQSVVDEEAGGAGGTLACLMAGHTADGMLVTEPHNLNVTISHGGIRYFRVTVTGKSAHAGLAHQGVNAIGKMYVIYRALEELDRVRGEKIRFPLYEKGSGRSCHLNIGKLTAGDWPSTVAGRAALECRVGFVPGETGAQIAGIVESQIKAAAMEDPWLKDHPPEIEWFGWNTEPWYQDPAHPFVAELTKTATDVLGHPPDLIGRASGNDGRFSQYFNMPAACTGPVAGNIHGLDEYVEISSAMTLIKILSLFILRWCGARPPIG